MKWNGLCDLTDLMEIIAIHHTQPSKGFVVTVRNGSFHFLHALGNNVLTTMLELLSCGGVQISTIFHTGSTTNLLFLITHHHDKNMHLFPVVLIGHWKCATIGAVGFLTHHPLGETTKHTATGTSRTLASNHRDVFKTLLQTEQLRQCKSQTTEATGRRCKTGSGGKVVLRYNAHLVVVPSLLWNQHVAILVAQILSKGTTRTEHIMETLIAHITRTAVQDQFVSGLFAHGDHGGSGFQLILMKGATQRVVHRKNEVVVTFPPVLDDCNVHRSTAGDDGCLPNALVFGSSTPLG
mmetsp:Transcript_26301/g.66133  ORF Transcript_26301/g.66133 Transcript_26301/m.66133 type:complete len:294 (+) Transcript_26301:479-1360(+)